MLHLRDALGRGDQADELDRARPQLDQPRDRRDRRVAGRQHRVDQDHVALRQVVRQLQVIFDRLQRARLAVEADMPDPRRRHQVEHAVEDAVAGAQDRHQAQFLAGQHRHPGAFERRLDLGLLERQVAGRLIAEQQADLAHQPAEFRRCWCRASRISDSLCRTSGWSTTVRQLRGIGAPPQNRVPSLAIDSGGPPSGRRSAAISRPAAQLPPSSTLASGNSVGGHAEPLRAPARPAGRAARRSAPAIRRPARRTDRAARRVSPGSRGDEHAAIEEQTAIAVFGEPGQPVEVGDPRSRHRPAARSANRPATG